MNVIFYSYKGGAGRTTVLLNTAYQLSLFGKSVFVIDFDFDSPGFDLFDGFDVPRESDQPGQMEYLSSVVRKAEGIGEGDEAEKTITEFVYESRGRSIYGGGLYCIRAGIYRDGRQLGKNKREIMDGREIIAYGHDQEGSEFGTQLQIIQGYYKPDYVLIDSRPGLAFNVGIELSGMERDNDAIVIVSNINKKTFDETLRSVETLLGDFKCENMKKCIALSQVVDEERLENKDIDKLKKSLSELRQKAEEYSKSKAVEINYYKPMALDYLVIKVGDNGIDPAKESEIEIFNKYKSLAREIIRKNEKDFLNDIERIESRQCTITEKFEEYENLLQRCGGEPEVIFAIGMQRMKNGESQLVDKDHQGAEAEFKMAAEYVEKAIEAMKEKKREVWPYYYLRLADIYNELEKIEEKEETQKAYNAKVNENYEAWREMVDSEASGKAGSRGNYEKKGGATKQAEAEKNRHSVIYWKWSQNLRESAQYPRDNRERIKCIETLRQYLEDAEINSKKAIAADNEDPRYYEELGLVLTAKANLVKEKLGSAVGKKETLAAVKTLLEKANEQFRITHNKGGLALAYLQQAKNYYELAMMGDTNEERAKQLEDSGLCFERAARRRDDYPDIYHHWGLALVLHSRITAYSAQKRALMIKGIEKLAHAVNLQNDWKEAHFCLGAAQFIIHDEAAETTKPIHFREAFYHMEWTISLMEGIPAFYFETGEIEDFAKDPLVFARTMEARLAERGEREQGDFNQLLKTWVGPLPVNQKFMSIIDAAVEREKTAYLEKVDKEPTR